MRASLFEPASSSSSAYPSSGLYRSASADALNARAHFPSNLVPNVPNPTPSYPPNHPIPLSHNNYPNSAGPSRVSTPQNGVQNSSSSLHGATAVASLGPYSHSQNAWSPAPSSLSIESAPIPRALNHDQYSYPHRQPLNDNFSINTLPTPAARSTYSSAGSNHSGDNMPSFDRIPNHSQHLQPQHHQLQDPNENHMLAHRISVSSAPPHRSTFSITQRDDLSMTMPNTASWGTSGASPRLGAVRRFQSETPRLPMNAQVQSAPPLDQMGAQLQPQSRMYSSSTSNVRQSTPDNTGANGGGHMEMLARAAAASVPHQVYQTTGGGGSTSGGSGSLGIPHFEASRRPSSGSGLRYPAQSVPPPTNTGSASTPSAAPRGYGSSTSPSSLSGAILAPSTSSRASSVVSGPALTSSPAYHPPPPNNNSSMSSSSPTPQSFAPYRHASASGYGHGHAASSFAV